MVESATAGHGLLGMKKQMNSLPGGAERTHRCRAGGSRRIGGILEDSLDLDKSISIALNNDAHTKHRCRNHSKFQIGARMDPASGGRREGVSCLGANQGHGKSLFDFNSNDV